jgi:hypothetical protein
MPNRSSQAKRDTAEFFRKDDAKMKREYSRVSSKAVRKPTKESKGQRSYPGYEDGSYEGRAQIRAFNRAGGPEFLNDDTDAREYTAAAEHALDARRKSGKKQESRRGRPKTMKEAVEKGVKEAE